MPKPIREVKEVCNCNDALYNEYGEELCNLHLAAPALLEACEKAAEWVRKDWQARQGPAFVKGQIALKPKLLDDLENAIGKAREG